eukprot:TRINITY_DN6026_c0_g1_i2.p1 TRINITY_DN6026_c0_g1~~TRINITY_DN6026_c0_g1_i2.p1  ORF type:complete len:164 (-),score=46.25 TRINITY_DN6026_c0_g1_i2:302-793(-)
MCIRDRYQRRVRGKLGGAMESAESERFLETIHRETRRRENHVSRPYVPEHFAHSGRHAWVDLTKLENKALDSEPWVNTTSLMEKQNQGGGKVFETRGPTGGTVGGMDKINPHRSRDVDFQAETANLQYTAALEQCVKSAHPVVRWKKNQDLGVKFVNGVMVVE